MIKLDNTVSDFQCRQILTWLINHDVEVTWNTPKDTRMRLEWTGQDAETPVKTILSQIKEDYILEDLGQNMAPIEMRDKLYNFPKNWEIHAKVNMPDSNHPGTRIVGYRVTLPDGLFVSKATDYVYLIDFAE